VPENARKLLNARDELCVGKLSTSGVRPMLAEALQHDGPVLVEVVVSRQELSMPPTINLDQMMGFSLYMIKAVLDSRGTEILDPAKTNLLR
jgi:pyruvate dehydrogenase (quinone)